MRFVAKAPSAGSTQRQATGLGRSFRGALATRGASSDAKGSGVPSHRPRVRATLALLGVLVALVASASLPAGASAAPSILWTNCNGGPDDTQCAFPRGIAANPLNGHVFVGEQSSHRINEFDAWGQLVKTWGWDVVASGPGQSNEIQVLTVAATAGSFTLTFNGQTTASLAATASAAEVQAALNALGTINAGGGSVTVAGGPGDATGSTPYRIAFDGGPLAGTDVAASTATDESLSGGVPSSAVTVATANPGATGFEICAPSNGSTCKAGVSGGGSGQLASPQGIAVDSSGNVYVVEFPNRRVQKFSSAGQILRGWGGDVVASGPHNSGTGPEICVPASGDICKAGVAGAANGQFGAWVVGSYIAIAPTDKIYVGDVERIQRFNAGGEYQDQITLAGETVQSLAADPSGSLYARFNGKANVLKMNSAGVPSCTIAVGVPTAVGTGPGGAVYVVDDPPGLGVTVIRQFTSTCVAVDTPFGAGEFTTSTGIATSGNSVCFPGGGHDLYVSSAVAAPNAFVRAFGPAPTDTDACEPPKVPPTIADQFAVSVGTEDATVRAKINPNFWDDTSYSVQYGTVACLEADDWEAACVQEEPASPGAQLGAGVVNEAVATNGVALIGLEPDTSYRYRFVAQSEGGGPVFGVGGTLLADGEDDVFKTFPPLSDPKVDCPNQRFRTGPSAFLPECRAYEMVSPLDKNNGDVNVVLTNLVHEKARLNQSTADGNGITYSSYRSFANPDSAPFTSQYLARRDPQAGWSTESLSPLMGPSLLVDKFVLFESQYRVFTEDLCNSWLFYEATPPLSANALEGYPLLYKRNHCGAGGYQPLIDHSVPAPALSPINFYSDLQGVSESAEHAVFRVKDKLTADAPSGRFQAYESYPGGLRAVCVLPDDTVVNQDCSAGTANQSDGLQTLVAGRRQSVGNAISDDGSRIFWSAAAGLFVRIDGTETLPIFEGSGARFHAAAADGSRIIFSVGSELREFDVDKALASESATTMIASGFVADILGASEDARRVYFVSTQVLTADEENSEGDKAVAGRNNIYFREADGGFQFVGALAPADVLPLALQNKHYSPTSSLPAFHSAKVSTEGMHVAFTSIAPLTGADNVDRVTGNALAEVFAYDAQAGELACVSCHPGGARPVGRDTKVGAVTTFVGDWAAAGLPIDENQLYSRRSLSDDGSRLFFESFNPLLIRDTNGKRDVYEFRWADEEVECKADGSLMIESSDGDPWGCLALISSGKSTADSEFVDASRSGNDVFIATESSLLEQDYGLRDIYDARVAGGFPLPPPEPPCEGEACQPPQAPPVQPTPASSSFVGPGNPPAARKASKTRCAKGKRQVRRGGKARCVKKKAQKRKTQGKKAKSQRAANRNGRAGR